MSRYANLAILNLWGQMGYGESTPSCLRSYKLTQSSLEIVHTGNCTKASCVSKRGNRVHSNSNALSGFQDRGLGGSVNEGYVILEVFLRTERSLSSCHAALEQQRAVTRHAIWSPQRKEPKAFRESIEPETSPPN